MKRTLRQTVGGFIIKPVHLVGQVQTSIARIGAGLEYTRTARPDEALLDLVVLGMLAELGAIVEAVSVMVDHEPKLSAVRTNYDADLERWKFFRHDGAHRIERVFTISEHRGNDPDLGDYMRIIDYSRMDGSVTTGTKTLDLHEVVSIGTAMVGDFATELKLTSPSAMATD